MEVWKPWTKKKCTNCDKNLTITGQKTYKSLTLFDFPIYALGLKLKYRKEKTSPDFKPEFIGLLFRIHQLDHGAQFL